MKNNLQNIYNIAAVLVAVMVTLVSTSTTATAQEVELPLTFEEGEVTESYFNGLRGSQVEVVENPDASGINESNKTGKFIKGDGADFAGFNFDLSGNFRIEEGESSLLALKIWSPRSDIEVHLELQLRGGGGKTVKANIPTANEWVELEFDLSELDPQTTWNRIFITIDWDGGPGDGSADWIWYFDDLDIQGVTVSSSKISLPLTFEEGETGGASFNGLRGSQVEVVENPDVSGINESNITGKFIKGDGADFAGFNFELVTPFQAVEGEETRVLSMKVWSPRSDIEVRIELQSDEGNAAIFDTVETAEEWVELVYDLSEIDSSISYSRIFMTYDWAGGPGDGSDDWIWYFDDLDIADISEESGTVSLPLTFEDEEVAEASFNGLRGSQVEVVENPDASGINESNITGKFIKGDGADFAGFKFELNTPFQANTEEDRVLSMKVWSPRSDIEVRIELQSDEGNAAIFDTVGTAEEWVELVYDLSEIDPEVKYSHIFMTYDWAGGPGDGSDDWIWYFDDLDIAVDMEVSTQRDNGLPSQFKLSQNYPNPFNPTTQIEFGIPKASNITLSVYNMLGQKVATLAKGLFQEGIHSVQFDASKMSSSVYIYKLTTEGGYEKTRKMMLIK